MKGFFLCTGVLLLMTLHGAAAQVYEVEGQAPGASVLLRCWLPEGVAVIRGVVVLSPGVGGDERGAVSDTAWQQAAAQWHFALAGSCLMRRAGL